MGRQANELKRGRRKRDSQGQIEGSEGRGERFSQKREGSKRDKREDEIG